ncbi:MAG TPA: hypothetical protein VIJ11_09455, partial [Galbitalea sp.]
ILGLVFCLAAFYRRVSRLEIFGDTLYWFTPFRHLMGQAPITDVVCIWTGHTFQLLRTQTVLELRDGRTVGIRDGAGIGAFVSAIVARSPGIDAAAWKPQEPRRNALGSSYPTNSDY